MHCWTLPEPRAPAGEEGRPVFAESPLKWLWLTALHYVKRLHTSIFFHCAVWGVSCAFEQPAVYGRCFLPFALHFPHCFHSFWLALLAAVALYTASARICSPVTVAPFQLPANFPCNFTLEVDLKFGGMIHRSPLMNSSSGKSTTLVQSLGEKLGQTTNGSSLAFQR